MNSIPSWAVKGAKVVCIDASTPGACFDTCSLVEGMVYTIAGISVRTRVNLSLVENTDFDTYGAFRFRPLITRTQEQDLEHFLPLLKSSKASSERLALTDMAREATKAGSGL